MNKQRTQKGLRHGKAQIISRYASLFVMVLAACSLLSAALADQTDLPGNPEDRIARTVRLEDLLGYAYRNNPEIQSAEERARAVGELHSIETGYPDPQVMVTYYPEPIETRLGPQDWNATLSQAIPYPGKLQKAGEVATAKAEYCRPCSGQNYQRCDGGGSGGIP